MVFICEIEYRILLEIFLMSTAFSDCFHEADREGGADFAALRLSDRQGRRRRRRRRRQGRDSRLVRETLRGGNRSDSQGSRRERLLRFQYSLEGREGDEKCQSSNQAYSWVYSLSPCYSHTENTSRQSNLTWYTIFVDDSSVYGSLCLSGPCTKRAVSRHLTTGFFATPTIIISSLSL